MYRRNTQRVSFLTRALSEGLHTCPLFSSYHHEVGTVSLRKQEAKAQRGEVTYRKLPSQFDFIS